MFKGSQSTNFKSDMPLEKVYELIEDELQTLGSGGITDNGTIRINASKFSGFACDCEITGRIRVRENKYSVELEWEAKPNWVIVIIASLCLFGLGLALLIIPYMSSNDIQKKSSTVLDNIRFGFK